MNNFLNKLEVFIQKEFTEKSGRIFLFSLIFLFVIPLHISFLTCFFVFLFLTNMLGSDIKNKKFSLIISLPYSYAEVFFSSYIFSLLMILIPGTIGVAFINFSAVTAFLNILRALIFATAYYGVILISVTLGGDNFGIPFLILLADLILGSFGSGYNVNPYRLISPYYQGNIWGSLIFSLVILSLSLYLFEKRGVNK